MKSDNDIKIADTAINFTQVEYNWLLGKSLMEQEQHGEQRAEYGKHVLTIASQELTKTFGKGFSITNLKNFRKFYLLFSEQEKGQALPALFENYGILQQSSKNE